MQSKQVSCRQLLQQVLRTSVSMPGRRKPPLVQCVVCGEQYRSRYRGCNPRCSAHRPSAAPADSLLPDELSRLQLDPVPSVDDWSITGRKYGEALGLLHAAVPAPYSRTHSKEDAVVIANVLLPAELLMLILKNLSWSELVSPVCRVCHRWLDGACDLACASSQPRGGGPFLHNKRYGNVLDGASCEIICQAHFYDAATSLDQPPQAEREDLEWLLEGESDEQEAAQRSTNPNRRTVRRKSITRHHRHSAYAPSHPRLGRGAILSRSSCQ